MNDRFVGYKSSMTEAAAAISSTPGFVKGLHVNFGWSATPDTLTVYDNTAASGTVLYKGKFGSGVANKQENVFIELGIPFTTGLYVSFTGGTNQIDYVTVIYDSTVAYGS